MIAPTNFMDAIVAKLAKQGSVHVMHQEGNATQIYVEDVARTYLHPPLQSFNGHVATHP